MRKNEGKKVHSNPDKNEAQNFKEGEGSAEGAGGFGSGKMFSGQVAGGSGMVTTANQGQKVSRPGYSARGKGGVPFDGEMIGSSAPEIGITKGTPAPTFPGPQKGEKSPPRPKA